MEILNYYMAIGLGVLLLNSVAKDRPYPKETYWDGVKFLAAFGRFILGVGLTIGPIYMLAIS